MADRFGYLTQFQVIGVHPTKANAVIKLHDPLNGIYNRHYVMDSAHSRIRAREAVSNIRINTDRNRRAPIEDHRIEQEVFVQKTTLTALETYYDDLMQVRGWEVTLTKLNVLGTATMTQLATLESVEVIEPTRNVSKQMVLNLVFYLWNEDWS